MAHCHSELLHSSSDCRQPCERALSIAATHVVKDAESLVAPALLPSQTCSSLVVILDLREVNRIFSSQQRYDIPCAHHGISL
jgi:hypothetical protein